MDKIGPVAVKNTPLADRRPSENVNNRDSQKTNNDVVSISQEGMKKHILGQVIANFTGDKEGVRRG